MIYEGQITLQIDTISLVLESCDFFTTDNNPLGYTNTPLEPSLNVTALPFGGVSLNKTPTKLREFEMDLFLSCEKAMTLRAIILCLNGNLENKVSDPWITMIDERIPLLEKDPRMRAMKGTPLTEIAVPAGNTLYYPIYAVGIEAPEIESAYFFREFKRFTVTGTELTILPTTEDQP